MKQLTRTLYSIIGIIFIALPFIYFKISLQELISAGLILLQEVIGILLITYWKRKVFANFLLISGIFLPCIYFFQSDYLSMTILIAGALGGMIISHATLKQKLDYTT
ncbi:MAG: hypothetical protein K1X55_18035 [Chitinophagales bacterium]|nr:hypothetical protein [Chitinophagales bacterium]